jgi:hypothetical protein
VTFKVAAAMNESTESPRPKSFAGAWFTVWGCIVAGMLMVTWTDFGTSEFRALSALLPFVFTGFMSVILLPWLWVASAVTKMLARKGRLPRWFDSTTIKALGFVLLTAQVGVAIYSGLPKSRLAAVMGGGSLVEGEVRVIGFNSFLAGRWLYDFTIAPAQLESIIQRLGMYEIEPYDMAANLQQDGFLTSKNSEIVKGVPGAEGVRMFREEQEDKTSGRWSVLVYRISDGKSWLYRGFQR